MNVSDRGFFGRAALLARLDAELAQVRSTGRGRMLAIRGRRQVGKSRLLTHFVETRDVPYLYTTAVKNASVDAQLARLARDAMSATSPLPDAATLFASQPANWDELFGRLRLCLSRSPGVVVIDEFPWAVQSDPSLEGTLQNAWGRALEHTPALFVLVGSDIAMMERLTEHDRPLFGRAGIVVVKPFDPGECAEMLGQGVSAMTVFDAHLVTGGYPRMLSRLARFESPDEFVRAQLSDEASDLAVMAQLSLDAEFPPSSNARRILSAIGNAELGATSFSRIAHDLGEDSPTAQTAVTRALKSLGQQAGVVSLDVPIGAQKNTRLRRYRVTDPYLRFWFRFVEPQLANIARGRADVALAAFSRGWEVWRGKAIEPIVREAILRLAPDLQQLRDVEAVGGWWTRDNSTEIDIVAARRGGDVKAVGSIKWREVAKFDTHDAKALRQSRHMPSGADDAPLLAVCPAGVSADAGVDLALNADELLAAWT